VFAAEIFRIKNQFNVYRASIVNDDTSKQKTAQKATLLETHSCVGSVATERACAYYKS